MTVKDIIIMFKIITWPVRMILIITGVLPLTRCSSGYSEKNGKVMFNGKEIRDKSFVVLSSEFAKDSSFAYYKERSFQYADVATFQAVDEHYAKDKNKVYYCDEYRDGQNYYMTKHQQILELKKAVPASFVSLGNGYGKDALNAWFCGKVFSVKDIASLKSIDVNFSKDTLQAYLNCIPIEGSDGKTFEKIDDNFAKDNKHIYYYAFNGEAKYNICRLPCDAATFKIIDYRFSKDKDKVFFLGFTIRGADAPSFEVLQSGYSKDKKSIYFQEKKIAGVDARTFEVFKENDSLNQDVVYAKDKNGVYADDKIIPGTALATFNLLGENYASDGKRVFYKTKIVKEASSASFKVYPHDFGNADAEDEKNKFHEGLRVTDYPTF